MEDVKVVRESNSRKRHRSESSHESKGRGRIEKANPSVADEDFVKDLPPNWIVSRSKKTNQIYFFNTETRMSIWEHPTDFFKKVNSEKSKNCQKESSASGSLPRDSPSVSSSMTSEEVDSSKYVSPMKRADNSLPSSSASVDNWLNNLSVKDDASSSSSNGVHNFSFTRLSTRLLSDSESVEPMIVEEPQNMDSVENMDVDSEMTKFRSSVSELLNKPVSFVGATSLLWESCLQKYQSDYFVVMDTNIFISHLPYIRELKKFRAGSK